MNLDRPVFDAEDRFVGSRLRPWMAQMHEETFGLFYRRLHESVGADLFWRKKPVSQERAMRELTQIARDNRIPMPEVEMLLQYVRHVVFSDMEPDSFLADQVRKHIYWIDWRERLGRLLAAVESDLRRWRDTQEYPMIRGLFRAAAQLFRAQNEALEEAEERMINALIDLARNGVAWEVLINLTPEDGHAVEEETAQRFRNTWPEMRCLEYYAHLLRHFAAQLSYDVLTYPQDLEHICSTLKDTAQDLEEEYAKSLAVFDLASQAKRQPKGV